MLTPGTTYDWCFEGGLKALTREKRRESRQARIDALPPTIRVSALEPRFGRSLDEPVEHMPQAFRPWRPLRANCRQRYRKPPNALHHLIPERVFLTLWDLQGGRCYICAKGFVPDDWASRDHVVPRAKGGEDGGNTLLACAACNQGKADSDPTPCELLYLAGVNLRFMSVFELIPDGHG